MRGGHPPSFWTFAPSWQNLCKVDPEWGYNYGPACKVHLSRFTWRGHSHLCAWLIRVTLAIVGGGRHVHRRLSCQLLRCRLYRSPKGCSHQTWSSCHREFRRHKVRKAVELWTKCLRFATCSGQTNPHLTWEHFQKCILVHLLTQTSEQSSVWALRCPKSAFQVENYCRQTSCLWRFT